MNVYLDNAASTSIDPKVLEAMMPYLTSNFGNPSSIHAYGRQMRVAIEKSRKKVANLLNVSPSEIFFTSGGTESNNMAIRCAIRDNSIQHVITSKMEHHSVSRTLEGLENQIEVDFLPNNEKGVLDMSELEILLKKKSNVLVSIMYSNNEIGNYNDTCQISALCETYGAMFHSDTVQAIGHFPIDLSKKHIHFATASAHKFHGPTGIGILYVKEAGMIGPFITGGAQERNMRGGTENVAGIVGFATALEMAHEHMEEETAIIKSLKQYMKEQLLSRIDDVQFNGLSGDLKNSLYTVLNVSFPPSEDNDMLLFNLDIAHIACSMGSACSSGATTQSHVLKELQHPLERQGVRFSFSKHNTREQIDYVVEQLSKLIKAK